MTMQAFDQSLIRSIGLGRVAPARHAAGLGQVFDGVSGYTQGIIPISHSVSGTWQQAYPTDTAGVSSTDLGGHLTNILATLKSAWSNPSASGFTNSGGYIYFAYYDPNPNPAQTPGEPPGIVIMRFHYIGSQATLGVCTYEGTVAVAPPAPAPAPAPPAAPSGGGGGQAAQVVSVEIDGPLPPYTGAWQSGVPTSSGLWWSTSTLQWTFVGNQPPTTVYPPGAQMSPGANQEIGTWVLIGNGIWGWYPPGGALGNAPASSYGIVVGGDGVTYATWQQAGAAANGGGSFAGPPAGSPPFMASTVGAWTQTAPAYWIFVPTAALATTDTTWLWVVGGLAVVGIVAAVALSD
jgi:hypothetical protein